MASNRDKRPSAVEREQAKQRISLRDLENDAVNSLGESILNKIHSEGGDFSREADVKKFLERLMYPPLTPDKKQTIKILFQLSDAKELGYEHYRDLQKIIELFVKLPIYKARDQMFTGPDKITLKELTTRYQFSSAEKAIDQDSAKRLLEMKIPQDLLDEIKKAALSNEQRWKLEMILDEAISKVPALSDQTKIENLIDELEQKPEEHQKTWDAIRIMQAVSKLDLQKQDKKRTMETKTPFKASTLEVISLLDNSPQTKINLKQTVSPSSSPFFGKPSDQRDRQGPEGKHEQRQSVSPKRRSSE